MGKDGIITFGSKNVTLKNLKNNKIIKITY